MSILVGKKAPDFKAAAVLPSGEIIDDFILSERFKGQYIAIIFYPFDFTFVCPSELIALNKRINKFKQINLEILTVSIDSQFTHHAWRNTPINAGGIGKVDFTMIADVNHNIIKSYNIAHPEKSIALRGSFVIDKNRIVRHQVVNDLPIGRNMDELIRITKAIQYHEKHGEVCPAGWNEGKKGMTASKEGLINYFNNNIESL